MIETSYSNMETSDAVVILFHGIIASVFVFAPIFYILFREFKKFTSRNEEEIETSSFSFIIVAFIGLALVNILYILFGGILYIISNDWGDIEHIMNGFWNLTINPSSISDTFEQSWLESTAQTIIVFRRFIELVSFATTIFIMLFGVKMSMSMIGKYNTSRRSFIGTVGKVLLGFVVSWYILLYYDLSTESILKHPKGGVWDVSTEWISGGIKKAEEG